ncbi:MAG: glutamine synthetase type III [Sphingobacteriia bacterium]|nr:glutamine synthetase type III [Sphingobacteriia bacterium]
MNSLRFIALEQLQARKALPTHFPGKRTSEYFGCQVFDQTKMQQYLSQSVFQKVLEAIQNGNTIDREIAEEVAGAMQSWALEKGCSHYTHWFQPLTGGNAEKHDSFFDLDKGKPIEKFSGNSLAQQEPDASSFPSGGIRNTFEARGYTAWDPSSPAFIYENAEGLYTLCIPTIFVAYTGEALDYKAPLLKSIARLQQTATEVCKYFDPNVTSVSPTLGVEQEYFLVDQGLYNARPDLALTGRTLFGHEAAKGQQLEDHYFGTIPERILAFMADVEVEAWKLGIPLKTRHNEVAPGQFECAPIFEEVNVAVDHNQLLMEVMEKISTRHQLKVLFHEKPFGKVNGSGKHNNWSLSTNTGKNLLSPGKRPQDNLQFLTFFVSIIKAVHVHADLLRASIASAGNDHRLGANEAPPAIISVFIGTQLDQILNALESPETISNLQVGDNSTLDLGIAQIPALLLDNTDRNRTSPFAFTGNKFEFRAVGSSANCGPAMIVINTIVADQLSHFKQTVDGLISAGDSKETALLKVIRTYIQESKEIRFEGNGYSQAWAEEAESRGLSNIQNTPLALKTYVSTQTLNLFQRNKVLSARELEARYEIKLESYFKKIQIESRVMGDLVINHILPVAIRYQNELIQNVKGLQSLDLPDSAYIVQRQQILDISHHILVIRTQVDEMIEVRKKWNAIEDHEHRAIGYCDEVFPFFDRIRYHTDKLELLLPDDQWPLPKYRELLFMR